MNTVKKTILVSLLAALTGAHAGEAIETSQTQMRAKLRKPSILRIETQYLSTAEKIARAMAVVESGGKPIKGASGEMCSVWQYTPVTWKHISSACNKALFNASQPLPFNRSNEELVTVWKVGCLMERGYDVEEIGRIWNTSLGGSEKPLRRVGVNKFGVRYDSVSHGKKVRRAFEAL